MDKEEAKILAKAFFDEKEERDRLAKEKAAIENNKKQKNGMIKELIIGATILGGLFMIWRALSPIINMANW